ncbi:MAG: glycoside hydrolase family 10 protein [Candidatus Spyradenecus sp.]
MRGLLLLCSLLFALVLRSAAVAVVYAELSVPESERRYAKALAGHVQRWYAEAGIEAALVADGELGAQRDLRLVVMVDCYAPPEGVLAAVRAQLKRGARFAICYSASEPLANLFGLTLGSYVRSDRGDWSRMALGEERPKGAPVEILQTSTNLFTVCAKERGVRPMAWWCDRTGKRTEVAWWRVRANSYWMTHILSGDGDERGKQLLLLAMAAEAAPGTWRTAAKHLYAQTLPELNGLADRLREATPKYLHNREEAAARQRQLAAIRQLIARQQRAVEGRLNEDSAGAYQAVADLRDLVHRAYGLTYWSRAGEVCGVWDHSGQGLYPGDWPRTAKLLASHGVTDVYVNVAGGGFALYPSKVLPQRGSENALAQAIAACRKEGLRVHAWILCFSLERAASPAVRKQAADRAWLLQDAEGRDQQWLDPTSPEVRKRLLETVRELASGYALDGIHLDFIRYPGLPQSLGPRVRARYEAERGKVGNWPACITEANGARREDFLRWRAGKMTDVVQEIRAWLRLNRPRLELSAAVYGKYPACVDSVGQDWLSWLRTGLLDSALPMNYTEDPAKLADWLGTQTADPRLAAKIVSGIGVTAAESRLGPLQVLDQIQAARRAKCRGFALFDLDETLRAAVLPVLSAGATAP